MRRSWLKGQLWLLLFVLTTCLSSFTARAAEEEALMDLWKQHMATPDDHDAVLKACQDFTSAHAGDPLTPVVRGLEEWHRLRAGHRDEALQMIAADITAPQGPVTDGGEHLDAAQEDARRAAAACPAAAILIEAS